MSRPFSNPSLFSLGVLLLLALPGLASPAASVAQPAEICDGIDNDGNGLIDEGFDTDGDGVARCCDKRPYFVTTTIGGNEIYAHHNECTNSFDAGPAPMADLPAGEVIRVHGVKDFDHNGTLDTIWTRASTGERFITSCNGLEWTTQFQGSWTINYFGGADLDFDGNLDFIGWQGGSGTGFVAVGPVTYPEFGGAFWFTPVWGNARTYNAEDFDGDGQPDFMLHQYATGGASSTHLDLYQGAPGFAFNNAGSVGTITNQPQNWGDLGKIDCDSFTDWIGGPDDDGDKGAVFAGFGDGQGGWTTPPFKIVDACSGSCAGSGTSQGSGMSQLYDWNCDGLLDLLVSHVETTGATATVQYWPNRDCDLLFTGPLPVITGGANRAKIASPLRN